MRTEYPERVERGRVKGGPMGTWEGQPFGAFFVKLRTSVRARILVDDGAESRWEHVSVTLVGKKRTPSWREMAEIKGLFWEESEAVFQFHPPEADWVNNHGFCLHLWRPRDAPIPLPPSNLVGVKDIGVIDRKTAIRLRKEGN